MNDYWTVTVEGAEAAARGGVAADLPAWYGELTAADYCRCGEELPCQRRHT